MKNPFIISTADGDNYADSKCSVNKMIIAKVPVEGIDDTIKGKSVSDIFSISCITKKIIEKRENLKIPYDIPKKMLPSMLLKAVSSNDEQVRKCAEDIAVFFGKRLALVFLTLKTALPENKEVRTDWTDEHWNYWKSVENIIVVGGLTNGKFGEILINEAQKNCILNGRKVYNIIPYENATYAGVIGCANLLEDDDGISLLMDFGQTNIKRSIVKRRKRKVVYMENLPLVHSEYMKWNVDDKTEKEYQAKSLHKYILNTIYDAYIKAKDMGEVNNQIVISIASYTHNGVLNSSRGGYSKLNVLCDNYGDYLSKELSEILKTPVKITLVHDGTAVALNFSDFPASVCITLGTFVGVGFTDIYNQ